MERIQRRATKYILNDYKSDYNHRLLSLRLLPLVMQLELYDIMCCLYTPDPSNTFPLQSYVHFSEGNTRSSTPLKLMHSLCKSTLHVTCISTNFHGSGTINLFLTIRNQVLEAFWSHFESHFLSTNPCTFHYNYLPMFCVCLFINYSNTLLVFHQYKSQSLYACPFLLFLSLSSCIYCEAKGEKKKKV